MPSKTLAALKKFVLFFSSSMSCYHCCKRCSKDSTFSELSEVRHVNCFA